MSEALEKVEKDYKKGRREVLRGLLNQCTDKQKEMFNRMYVSVDKISDKKINRAVQQVEATIKKNEAKSV